MSERSPEDFPKPTIDAGGNPQNAQPHLEDVPYSEMTLQEAIDKGLVKPVVNPDTLQQVQEKTYWSDRPPAVEPAIDLQPASKKWSLKKKVGAAAASALVLMGIGVGVSNTLANPTGLPQKPAATGPAVPGQSEAPLPATPNTGETQKALTPADYKFHDDNGTYESSDDTGSSLSYYDLVDQSRLDPTVVRSNVEAAVFKKAQDAANWFPNPASVRETLNKPTEQLTGEDFVTVARLHRQTVLKTILKNDGALYQGLDKIGEDTANTIAQSNDDSEKRYQVTFNFKAREGQLEVTDNSLENSVDDNGVPSIGTYQLRTTGMTSDITSSAVTVSADGTKKNTMQLNAAIGMKKLTTPSAQ